ncbi:MAG: response regulator [Campylobacterota bacterium]|nr:response regulator [Campylobacterota bacterium]
MLRVLFLLLFVSCSVVLAQPDSFQNKYNEEEKKVDTSKSLDSRLDDILEDDPQNPYAQAKKKIDGIFNGESSNDNRSKEGNRSNPTSQELLEQHNKIVEEGGSANPWKAVDENFKSNPLIEMIFGKEDKNQEGAKQPIFTITTITIATILILTIIGTLFLRVIGKFKTDYNKLQNKHDLLINEHAILLQQFEAMFVNLVYRVERSTNKMISNRNKLIQESMQECLSHCKEVKQSDRVLLDALDELVEYFKARSKLLQLSRDSMDLNKLLANMTKFVAQNHQDRPIEITYDINLDVPQFFLGDYKRLNNMLISAIDYATRYARSSIRLVVSKYGLNPKERYLEFKFITDSIPLNNTQKEQILMPFNYEFSQKALFLSHTIAGVMDGTFDIKSNENGNIVFVDIPLDIDEESQKEYHISNQIEHREELNLKHIAIIDKNNESANALKKSFLHFTPNVQILTPESIHPDTIKEFYLIMVEHTMLDKKLIKTLSTIQEKQALRVVAMHSSFKRNYAELKDELIQYYVNRPLSPLDTLLIFTDKYAFSKKVSVHEEEEDLEFIQRKRGEGELMLKQYLKPLPEAPNKTKESLVDFTLTAILFIDDDLMYQKMFNFMIKPSGMRTALASTKTEALKQLERYYNNFGCIVINIGVNHNEGYDICSTIREDKAYDKIPIFAMVDSVYDRDKLIKSGVNGYILKPMRAPYFYMALSLFLDKIDRSTPLLKLLKSEKILDITQGVMYSNHKEKTYTNVLQEFSQIYVKSAQKFEKLVINKQYGQLKEFIFSMRNSTGVIGAHRLHNMILDLEKLINDQEYSSLKQYIEKYAQAMEDLNINIEIYMRSHQEE